MGLITLLFTNPGIFIVLTVLLIYSIIAHEIAHGWVAYLFGDDTAKRYGRLSLNPLLHVDPVGTLMLFIVGFGWAKPVPVDYNRLRNSRLGLISVSLAGCLTNILIAVIAVFLSQYRAISGNQFAAVTLYFLIKINIVLGSFNLIPIPPLDGSRILMGLLPKEAQVYLARLEPFGFFILALLLFTGILNPVIDFMQKLITGLIALLFGFSR